MRASLCVVGGGPAGAAAAALAAAAGLAVTMVHDGARTHRAETLSPAAVRWLRRWGLASSLEMSGAVRSSGTLDAFGADPVALRRMSISSPWGPAWHVDRARFDRALRALAVARGARLQRGSAVRVEREARGFTVHTTRHATSCDLLVDATGAAAVVARRLGVRHRTLDRQVAVFARSAAPRPEPALEIARCRHGWLYLTPVPGGGTQVAFVTDAQGLGQAAPGDALRAAASERGIALEAGATPAMAVLCRAVDSVLPRGFFVVGDAAWCPDPLSGQGLARALHSAGELVVAIEASAHGRPQPLRTEAPLACAREHLRQRAALLAGPWPADDPYSRNRARAVQGAEECFHGHSLHVD